MRCPQGALIELLRLAAAAFYLGSFVLYGRIYDTAPDPAVVDQVGVPLLAALSVIFGVVVRRWWAPAVPIFYAPTIFLPSSYYDGVVDLSNGIAFIILFLFPASFLVAVGVGLSKLRIA